MQIKCVQCEFEPERGSSQYCCPVCGGYFDYPGDFEFKSREIDPNLPGIWRFRSTFGLDEEVIPISLGEGGTPLIWDEIGGKQVAFKLDYLNPSGSYKDRGSTVLISYLNWLGITTAIEDSSGNAGASFAAYCSRAGMHGKVYVPDYASGPKRAQIEAYGSELVPIPGPRSKAAEVVAKEAKQGITYASHVNQPYVLPGYATAAYEIFEQVGAAPGSVVIPAGQGSFLIGIARGFESLLKAGLITNRPQIIGVQSLACAPLWVKLHPGVYEDEQVQEGETIAEGIRIAKPLRGDQVIDAVRKSGGTVLAVQEKDILPGRDELARRGMHVEPTSAVVWPALINHLEQLREPVVVVLTGSGLKFAGS
jgi:threonine synthase